MPDAKIEVKVGELSFSGEGSEKWLAEQLDKLLEKFATIELSETKHKESKSSNSHPGTPASAESGVKGSLASYLKEKSATTNQIKKFLATALWVESKQKLQLLSTGDINKALDDARQKALTNTADCLNQNVSKGFCEKKEGNQFFITEEGRESLA